MRCKFCNSDQEEEENMVITFFCDSFYDQVDNIWSQSKECRDRVDANYERDGWYTFNRER